VITRVEVTGVGGSEEVGTGIIVVVDEEATCGVLEDEAICGMVEDEANRAVVDEDRLC